MLHDCHITAVLQALRVAVTSLTSKLNPITKSLACNEQ